MSDKINAHRLLLLFFAVVLLQLDTRNRLIACMHMLNVSQMYICFLLQTSHDLISSVYMYSTYLVNRCHVCDVSSDDFAEGRVEKQIHEIQEFVRVARGRNNLHSACVTDLQEKHAVLSHLTIYSCGC